MKRIILPLVILLISISASVHAQSTVASNNNQLTAVTASQAGPGDPFEAQFIRATRACILPCSNLKTPKNRWRALRVIWPRRFERRTFRSLWLTIGRRLISK